MNHSVLGQIVLTFGALSVLSIGGANATIPEIHRQVVDALHWMDDATFSNLIAIGQSAPGPNVMIVSMIGWHMAGITGLVVATFSIVLPSCLLAVGVGRLMTRFSAVEWVGIGRRALAPIAVGLMLASGYVMGRSSYRGLLSIAILTAATLLILATRRSPLLGIAAGVAVGVIGHRLDAFG